MSAMQDFTIWLLDNLPDFLMSEPIIYLWGIMLFAYLVKLLLSFRRF